MPIALPESVKKVLEDKAYGHVITFNPNGRPQVTMVWMDVELALHCLRSRHRCERASA